MKEGCINEAALAPAVRRCAVAKNLWYIEPMKKMLLALLLSPDGRRR